MKAIDLIKNALAMGDGAMMMLLEDLRNAPMTFPTPRGGNHPLWVLGHITFVEASMPKVLFGEPHPLAHWATLFAAGGLRSLPYFIQFDAAVTSIRYASYVTMPLPTIAVSDPSGSMYLLLSASPFGSLAITKLQPPQILIPSRSGSR